jgi:alkylated DNA repair dioxygenase AlkB
VIRLYKDALDADAGRSIMADLLQQTRFEQPEIRMMGKSLRTPRLVAWYGDEPYGYSGLVHPSRPWTPILDALRALASRLAQSPFNGVLLNLYRDGSDSMGWHSDDEPELGANPVVASLSLGATRRFRLRHKRDRSLSFGLDLSHGSMLVMSGPIQHHWQHALPKTARAVGARLNLTFRWLLPTVSGGRSPDRMP